MHMVREKEYEYIVASFSTPPNIIIINAIFFAKQRFMSSAAVLQEFFSCIDIYHMIDHHTAQPCAVT
jgi:hypothetical protein